METNFGPPLHPSIVLLNSSHWIAPISKPSIVCPTDIDPYIGFQTGHPPKKLHLPIKTPYPSLGTNTLFTHFVCPAFAEPVKVAKAIRGISNLFIKKFNF